jgi:hypothetical protein
MRTSTAPYWIFLDFSDAHFPLPKGSIHRFFVITRKAVQSTVNDRTARRSNEMAKLLAVFLETKVISRFCKYIGRSTPVRSPNMARSSLCAVFSLFSIAGIHFCWSAHHDHDRRDHAPRKNSRPCADLNPGLWS